MNHVTGFLISPRRPPPEASRSARRPPSFLPPFFSVNGSIVQGTPRPLTLQVAAFLVLSMPPGHYLPPPQRLPAASSTIDLLGRRTRRFLGTKRERAVRVTSNDRRQAAPLVSAIHGCYEHCADDVMFLLSLILFASL